MGRERAILVLSGDSSRSQLDASNGQRWAAGVICCVLAAALVVTLPIGSRALPAAAAFLPIYLTLATVSDSFNAFLLLMQYRASGSVPLALLSLAYLVTATLIVAQACAFPGIFAPTGLFGARPQTAVWLWAAWHGGFPTLVGVYAVSRRTARFRLEPTRLVVAGLVAAGIGAGLAIAFVTYVAPLPELVNGRSYAGGYHGTWQTVFTLAVIALVLTVALTRLTSTLDLWLAVALFGTLCDIILTVSAGARFSLGWYLARVYAAITSLTISAVFIAEFSHLYMRFARLASTDALTGIANRRTFDARLEDELRAAARDGTPLSLIMLDVDDFKRYNDTYGHTAGDETLRMIADAARTVVKRPRDVLARYGGEEFVAVLPSTDLDGAVMVAERIRSEVANRRLPHRESRAAPYVTVSAGAATFASTDDGPRAFVDRADAALYEAKRLGRNRVARAGSLQPAASVEGVNAEVAARSQ